MDPLEAHVRQSRRDFLTSVRQRRRPAGAGVDAPRRGPARRRGRDGQPAGAEAPHFAPKAKACICIYLEGAPSQIDLFDPKPKLDATARPDAARVVHQERPLRLPPEGDGPAPRQPPHVHPARRVRHGAVGLPAPPRRVRRRHRADPVDAHRGVQPPPRPVDDEHRVPTFGRPSMGSWLNYGLGSESNDLPGYVVLTAGRGTSGGASNWSSGFLPTHLPGRPLPQPGRARPQPEQPRRPQRRHAGEDHRGPPRPEPAAAASRSATPRSTAGSPPTSWPSGCRRPPPS